MNPGLDSIIGFRFKDDFAGEGRLTEITKVWRGTGKSPVGYQIQLVKKKAALGEWPKALPRRIANALGVKRSRLLKRRDSQAIEHLYRWKIQSGSVREKM